MLIAGRYRLLDLVGRGGMGRVWRARDEMLHREVAVKEVVPPSWLADHERAELRSRTLREARAAARLNHPAVVRLYDVVPVEGSPWIVMEYVPSRTLQDVLDTEGPRTPAEAARIGLALLGALRAAHTAGVLHRDVKPQNVLMAHDGRVMLTDFGLATFDGGDGAMTRPGMVLGSPQYVAPERASEGVSTVAADLWSLGATLHTIVEGRSPYARSTAMATLSALAAGPPDPAPHAGPLAPVLAGLLRRDPRDRLDHEAAHRLLTAAATAEPSEQDPTIPLPEPGRPAADRAAAPGDPPAGDAAERTDTSGEHAPDASARAVGRTARRAALVVTALLVAAAAGVGTALAVSGDEPTGTAGRSATTPPPDRPPDQRGPRGPSDHRPDRPGRPPDSGAFPPPPFPCVRPDAVGAPVPPASPAPGERFQPPAGWVWHADSAGFRVSVPATWHYSRDGAVACFQDPATGRAFSVAEGGAADPLVRLTAIRDAAAAAGALPGYDEIRLATGGGGAEWESRWTAPYGARLHARQHVAGAPAGSDRWTLGWITDDRDWTAAAADWTTVRTSFRLPR
ncbi:Serine/threonine protein kinase [Micromonospora coriariae]|uniref:non-specific serine/threonine protein kinase n=1 Tax=Micromonospora coriariae TaxID=285665 RepID=A0A1C4X1D5_9ACTN|nr:Serine/threonine protein kinase [Micromonospora coriariae]